MSFEHFPVKEKLATNLDSQLAWLVREMGYSRDKTQGYEEKRVRLAREPSDNQSVFGFMSGYWHRFNMANAAIAELKEPEMVSRALQANAKVVAGLADKVAFASWLDAQNKEASVEPEPLLDMALDAIHHRVDLLREQYTDEELLAFNGKEFQDNPMGQAILRLHEAFNKDPHDTDTLHAIALDGAAAGVLMWQAYGRNLENQGYSTEMPMPGASSGNIEPWA